MYINLSIAAREHRIWLFVLLISFSEILLSAQFDKISATSLVYIECSKDGVTRKGTGVIVSKEGRILTAGHLVIGDASCVGSIGSAAITPNRRLIRGRRSNSYDAQILKIVPKPGESFVPVMYTSALDVAQGDIVTVLGFPDGGTGEISIREGLLSTTVSDANGMLETHTMIGEGMSGSAALLVDGSLVGIVAGVKLNVLGLPTASFILSVEDIANELKLQRYKKPKLTKAFTKVTKYECRKTSGRGCTTNELRCSSAARNTKIITSSVTVANNGSLGKNATCLVEKTSESKVCVRGHIESGSGLTNLMQVFYVDCLVRATQIIID